MQRVSTMKWMKQLSLAERFEKEVDLLVMDLQGVYGKQSFKMVYDCREDYLIDDGVHN